MQPLNISDTIIKLTKELNQVILDSDYDRYCELTSPNITSFEPEGDGHFIPGITFHEFYFKHLDSIKETSKIKTNLSILSPNVKLLADNRVAVIAYIKLIQYFDGNTNNFKSKSWEETRVWNREGDKWIQVHFHRSLCKRQE